MANEYVQEFRAFLIEQKVLDAFCTGLLINSRTDRIACSVKSCVDATINWSRTNRQLAKQVEWSVLHRVWGDKFDSYYAKFQYPDPKSFADALQTSDKKRRLLNAIKDFR